MSIVEQAYAGVLIIGSGVGILTYAGCHVIAWIVRPRNAPANAAVAAADAVRRVAMAVAVLAALFPALAGVVAIHHAEAACGWPNHGAFITDCQ